jgi:hypothetical protein
MLGKGEEMQTIFSHVVQKRLSRANEDVATDALAFVLHSSESARNGMMKLLRGIAPDMPALRFRTQQTKDGIRPDMLGYDEVGPRVFVENKFWAGLTDNQPEFYLRGLAKGPQPTILLVVVPEAREQTLWGELERRLRKDGIPATNREPAACIVHSVTTEIEASCPILALTSWTKLLSMLELEVADDPSARSDLLQLRALCEAADNDAFVPISSAQITDQRNPAFILQLNSIWQAAVDIVANRHVLSLKGTNPQASAERIGRYAYFGSERRAAFWIGTHFDLWKEHGRTPLWGVFSPSNLGRAQEVRTLLEPWAAQQGVFTASQGDNFVVALDIACGEEKDVVVNSLVQRLNEIAGILSVLAPIQWGT